MKNSSRQPSGSSSFRSSKRPSFSLEAAGRMMPLVKQIVATMAGIRERRETVRKQLEVLEGFRLQLTWESRKQRYQLQDELGLCQDTWLNNVAELKSLGIQVLGDMPISLGIPTDINDKPAYWSWNENEENIAHWHFRGETMRRPIPSGWFKPVAV